MRRDRVLVCPTSLKHQWQREIERLGRRAESAARHRRRPAQRKSTMPPGFLQDPQLREGPAGPRPDLGWAPELVIVDEAQRIKNWNTIARERKKRLDSTSHRPQRNAAREPAGRAGFHRPVRRSHRLGPTWNCCTSIRSGTKAVRSPAIKGSTGSARRWSRC